MKVTTERKLRYGLFKITNKLDLSNNFEIFSHKTDLSLYCRNGFLKSDFFIAFNLICMRLKLEWNVNTNYRDGIEIIISPIEKKESKKHKPVKQNGKK